MLYKIVYDQYLLGWVRVWDEFQNCAHTHTNPLQTRNLTLTHSHIYIHTHTHTSLKSDHSIGNSISSEQTD